LPRFPIDLDPGGADKCHPCEQGRNHPRYPVRSTRRFHAQDDAVLPGDRVAPIISAPIFGPKTSIRTDLTCRHPHEEGHNHPRWLVRSALKRHAQAGYGNPEGLRGFNRFYPNLRSRSTPGLSRNDSNHPRCLINSTRRSHFQDSTVTQKDHAVTIIIVPAKVGDHRKW
jgi:hypothetical protein